MNWPNQPEEYGCAREELPVAHVFTRDSERIHHRWSSELFTAPTDPGQHPRYGYGA